MASLLPQAAPHDSGRKRLEYVLKRALLRALSAWARLGNAPSSSAEHLGPPVGPAWGPQHRVLIIRLNNIGDALVSTPLVHALRQHSGAQLEVLCSPRNRVVWAEHPDIARVHVLPKGLWARLQCLAVLRRTPYHLVLDLHDDVSTTAALAVALLRAPVKLSLAHGLPELYTAQALAGSRDAEHIMTRLARLAPLLGVPLDPASQNVVFPVSAAATAAAQAWRAQYAPTGRLVGMNISAGTAARYWAAQHWAALAAEVKCAGGSPVILAAPPDRSLGQAVAEAGQCPLFIAEGYGHFAAFVYGLDLLITPDTAVVHLASAARVPVFGLYVGVSTAGHLWTPYQSPHAVYTTAHPDLSQTLPNDVIPLLAPFLARHL